LREQTRIRGSLRLELLGPGGVVLARRRAHNTVVRSGAELVGALFAGSVLTPVNGMGVGTNAVPLSAPYELAALTTTDDSGQPLAGVTAVAIAPTDVKVETLTNEQRVLVSVRAVLPKEAALSHDQGTSFLAEAALGVLAGDKLSKIYNRVVFDPVPKGKDHELALYWEISFPYGV
jgi:hypothetical protein